MSTDWEIGYAECDITPRVGHSFMTGFGRDRICQGTHLPLIAQAVAIQDSDGATSALMAVDVLSFDRPFINSLRHTIGEKHGVAPEAIAVCASHTHWGPAVNYSVSLSCGQINPWYVAELEDKLLGLVDDAMSSLASGTVQYGSLETRIGHHRRTPGGQTWAPNPEGSYDTHTPVLRLRREGSSGEILLVGHACHPTSSGAMDMWTPDYPSAMRRRIREILGDQSRGMFVMGCGGDAKVTHKVAETGKWVFSSSVEDADKAGVALADAALTCVTQEALTELTGTLKCVRASGNLTMTEGWPVERIEALATSGAPNSHETWWARQMMALPMVSRQFAYEVLAWRLGDALSVLFLEGEVCSGLGPLARSITQTPHAMAVGYANVTAAYIPTRQIVIEGGYEGESSHRAYFLPAPFTEAVESEFTTVVQNAVDNLQ